MTDNSEVIAPKAVPLSHATKTPFETGSDAESPYARRLLLGILIVAAVIVLYFVFTFTPERRVETSSQTGATPIPTAPQTGAAPFADDGALPPFQTLMRAQAREKAQAELAGFVELQLQLQQQMRVDTWGQDSYEAAKVAAEQGDTAFMRERYDESIASYVTARELLAELIVVGEQKFEDLLQQTTIAINDQNQASALSLVEQALLIKPDDSTALALKVRAHKIDSVLTLFRQARNHELAEAWADAVSGYQAVLDLDPETRGVSEAITRTRTAETQQILESHISAGFLALENNQFAKATTAFNKALKIQPANPIALGGLQQTESKSLLGQVDRLKVEAQSALDDENWSTALAHYDEILSLDANLKFAKEGKATATEQLRALTILNKIIDSPDNLSSKKLFDEANATLTRARTLKPMGPTLASRIDEVDHLLSVYSQPVAVTLKSDNQTDVILSTVGRLGTFDVKQVSLRPGAYTLIGSRNGCRDVRTQITVRPEMPPVDIRCMEQLPQ
ncbi:MAG: hypothetical protein O3A63_08050 [Proteobacteria bacterium]|nr:hypothetical protein [Pseudomonadota bacterium]